MDQPAQTGPQEGRCGAIKERGEDGQPIRWCRNWPMKGQTRCRLDGAAAPHSLAAARRRQQEAQAAKAVATFGLRRDVTAEDALTEELAWTAGHVAWLRDRVAELDPEALVWGRTSEASKEATEFPGVDTTREAAPSVWLVLYQRERAHLLAVSAAILKAGVDERRVRIAEAQGVAVAGCIRAVLADLGHDLADPSVLQVVSDRLRELSGVAA